MKRFILFLIIISYSVNNFNSQDSPSIPLQNNQTITLPTRVSPINSINNLTNDTLLVLLKTENNETIPLRIEGSDQPTFWTSFFPQILSFIAIFCAYYSVHRQIISNEKSQRITNDREWSYKLIEYVSEYIVEIESNLPTKGHEIRKGNAMTSNQKILENKIKLLLNNNVERENQLLKEILAYKDRENSIKSIGEWLVNISNIAQIVIKDRML